MTRSPQEALVERQFGPQAAAYVASTVHATGDDLARIGAIAAERRPRAALDLGCGGGHVAFALAPAAGEVTACDLSPAMLAAVAAEAARRGHANITTVEASAEALPFADGRFDLVASRYSAHHWGDLCAGLAEARRVLKPGGMAVFADVVAPPSPVLDTVLQAIEILRDTSHVRDYSIGEWTDRLGAARLAPRQVRPARLRLDFSSWIARMRTPPEMVAAIRALQASLAAPARRHFAVEEDGSFSIDTVLIEAEAV